MSYHLNKEMPEWSTEGIQIGSIGSAVGMLGMWTGANQYVQMPLTLFRPDLTCHIPSSDSTDPLGPIWTWKVA